MVDDAVPQITLKRTQVEPSLIRIHPPPCSFKVARTIIKERNNASSVGSCQVLFASRPVAPGISQDRFLFALLPIIVRVVFCESEPQCLFVFASNPVLGNKRMLRQIGAKPLVIEVIDNSMALDVGQTFLRLCHLIFAQRTNDKCESIGANIVRSHLTRCLPDVLQREMLEVKILSRSAMNCNVLRRLRMAVLQPGVRNSVFGKTLSC